jgi:hypothetical protein
LTNEPPALPTVTAPLMIVADEVETNIVAQATARAVAATGLNSHSNCNTGMLRSCDGKTI